MPPELTPEEKVEKVYQTLVSDLVLPEMLTWVLAKAVQLTPDVHQLTADELASLYNKLAEDATTGAPGFR